MSKRNIVQDQYNSPDHFQKDKNSSSKLIPAVFRAASGASACENQSC